MQKTTEAALLSKYRKFVGAIKFSHLRMDHRDTEYILYIQCRIRFRGTGFHKKVKIVLELLLQLLEGLSVPDRHIYLIQALRLLGKDFKVERN
jgi:hypothetical protein